MADKKTKIKRISIEINDSGASVHCTKTYEGQKKSPYECESYDHEEYSYSTVPEALVKVNELLGSIK
jgi:hypothetical protein